VDAHYQLLDWDTRILGIHTAKIIPERLTELQLQEILQELKHQGVALVFWCSGSQDLVSQSATEKHHGFLADRKVTYCMDLRDFSLPEFDHFQIKSYQEKTVRDDIKQLALDVGLNSRFGLDPKITVERCKAVYEKWLENSINRTIAKEVLVIEENHKIIGFVTLGEKNGRGDIGLIAVDKNHRGKNLATQLVRAAQLWCQQQGYTQAQVVTQLTNVAACKLYEKNGYQIEKIEHFYHFWI
jgi:dTDP-4-amino-4,6-dideoxy-D-galactose acyltransferase